VNFVTYEDFMPSQHLPNYHWRAVVTYLTKLEGLSENFIFVPEGSYFIDTVRQTHLVSEINGHMIYNYDEGTAPKDGLDRTVLLETQKLVPEVPDDVNVLEFETRTPVLVKKTVRYGIVCQCFGINPNLISWRHADYGRGYRSLSCPNRKDPCAPIPF
jgi:hypothetical protein